jgi:hypothetical protein
VPSLTNQKRITPCRRYFDFRRNLDMNIIHCAQQEARAERARITSEFASRGMGQSTSLIAAVIGRVDILHKKALEHATHLIHEFCSGGSQMSLTEVTNAQLARPAGVVTWKSMNKQWESRRIEACQAQVMCQAQMRGVMSHG